MKNRVKAYNYDKVKGCNNAGGQCCASSADGTGTVKTAKKNDNTYCGYCFTGKKVKIPKIKTSMQ